jgi:N-methylhydantoinase B/oxoprolinase/acetone carboxylase alpha subunit
MFTRSQYAALLLAAIFAATGVVSDSTILLNSGGVSISKPKVNHGPLTTIPTAAPVTTTTTTATQDTAPVPNVVLSAASTASTLPAAVPRGPLGNVTHGGFSAPLKKKRTSKADSSTPKRSDNFNSSIVDQWHVVLQVGT